MWSFPYNFHGKHLFPRRPHQTASGKLQVASLSASPLSQDRGQMPTIFTNIYTILYALVRHLCWCACTWVCANVYKCGCMCQKLSVYVVAILTNILKICNFPAHTHTYTCILKHCLIIRKSLNALHAALSNFIDNIYANCIFSTHILLIFLFFFIAHPICLLPRCYL